MQSEIQALGIIGSVNEYPVPGVQIVERGGFFFVFVNFSSALYCLKAWNRPSG